MPRTRRGGGAAPQAAACGVWLDTAELKQSPAQSLIAKAKASSRALEVKRASFALMQSRTPQPRTKQTTISAFFSSQTGGKDKENSRLSQFILNKDCKEKGVSLAASPVKILALPQMEEAQKQPFRAWEEPVQLTAQCPAPAAPASPTPSPDWWLLQAQSHSPSGVGEDCCCCFSFTQDSEGNRVIAHRKKSGLFAGETDSASGSVIAAHGVNKGEGQLISEEVNTGLCFQPRLGVNRSRKRHPPCQVNLLIEGSESENRNPETGRDSAWAAAFCSSPQSPARAQPLQEHSHNASAGSAVERRANKAGLRSPLRQLFTQDSEGNRVIAHSCRSVQSPHRQLLSSPCKGCPSAAASRSCSRAGELQLDLCCDSLFTQDSEGNRVIKHC